MSSIDNSTRKAQQSDLNDLQADYNRKKKQISQENEAQIADLKDYYYDKKENVREENEAAINHIRKRQSEIVANAYEDRKNLNDNYNARTASMQKNFDEKLKETRDKRQTQLEGIKSESAEVVKETEAHAENEIEHIRQKSNDDMRSAKQRYNKDMAQINEFSEKRLTRQRDENEMAIKGEVEHGRSAQERLRTRQEKEMGELRARGDKTIVQTKDVQEKKLARMNDDNARQYEKQQQNWVAKDENLSNQYSTRISHNKQAFDNQLKTQNEHFQSTYANNEEAQRESLNIQKDRYTKELANTRREFLQASQKYADKQDDPFYRVQDRGSQIIESPNSYILRAYVPEHEKENVKVSVQKDRVVVSGQRSFKDKLDEDDKSVSSSTYQTFREDFPFSSPVMTEGMTRERQGDWVVYTIPKTNFSGFNRKA